MTFTLKQAFSLTDGRLSTTLGDIYDMLNFIFSANLFTHQLPEAYDKLKEENPEWFADAVKQLNAIKAIVGNDFDALMKYIDEYHADTRVEFKKIE